MNIVNRLACGVLIICAIYFASCATSTTTINNTWKDKNYHKKAQKIVVIMVAKRQDLRSMFEGRFAAELRDRGIDAIQSSKLVTLEELTDREFVKSKILGTGADTVLISRLVDSKTMEVHRPGRHAIPSFYRGWGTYYDTVIIDSSYTDNIRVSYIETNLYDIKTEKIIWSSHSKTKRKEGEQQLVNTFIERVLKKLSSDKII